MVTLCVRAAFDLFLQAKNYPKGSEVLMTAINIPDMVYIVRSHGLHPVPIELNLDTLAPVSLDIIKERVTEKTKCMVFAYIYGLHYDLEPYLDFLESKGIDVIEDVAQSFNGPKNFTGNLRSKMALFSFGLIKH